MVFTTTGSKTITATYSGDGNYASSSGTEGHFVGKASTTTTITAETPDPSNPGQAVLVSFSVIGGGVTPTGTVDVSGADINCSITLSGGTGSCNVVFNTTGTKSITATYNGDGNYLGSSNTILTHAVLLASTTTINSIVSEPSLPGDTVDITVTVSGAGSTPTGTIGITGGNTPCVAVPLVAGVAHCNTTLDFSTAGAKLLTATYSGDAIYSPSSGTASHTVSKAPSTTTITLVAPSPSTVSASVAVSVLVVGAGVTPTGSVGISISGGQTSTCTVTLSGGIGTCNIVFSAPTGTYTITANYGGDGNHWPSSNTALQTVN